MFLFSSIALLLVSESSSLRLGVTQTFDLIRNDCGQICDTTIEPIGKGKLYDIIEKHINCDDLFRSDFIEGWQLDRSGERPVPPRLQQLKESARAYYSYQGKVNVSDLYFDETNGRRPKRSDSEGNEVWSERYVNDMRSLFKKRSLTGNYGLAATNEIASGLRYLE